MTLEEKLEKYLRNMHAIEASGLAYEQWLSAALGDTEDANHCEAVVLEKLSNGTYE